MESPFRSLAVAAMMLSVAACAAGLLLLSGTALAFDVLGPARPFSLQLGADDPTTGGFLLLVGTVGFAASWAGRREHLTAAGDATVLTFIAGLALVPLAENLFTFFLAWETMSVSPGLLLILSERAKARRAGILYLVYAQASAIFLLLGFLVWGNGLTARLDDLLGTPLPTAAAVFLLLGCLAKSGTMPFHIWLPEAHPEAPSHVSALMSGVMVAVPAFILLRFLLPSDVEVPLAMSVLLLGALSAALGALHGLHARDFKRVLAFTTIAHLGVVYGLLGLGLLLPGPRDAGAAAFIAPAVTVYILSHGWSKGALFLVAGEIHHLTGELSLDRLGGLGRTLGGLATLACLGGLGLAALPPTAGFAAEIGVLSTFLATLPALPAFRGVVVLGALFLIAIGAGAGLAATAKIVLGAFFGPARGPAPTRSASLAGPAVLVALSLAVGVAPGILWMGLDVAFAAPWELSTPMGAFTLLPLVGVAAALTIVGLALGAQARRRPTVVPPWACGLPAPTPRQTYTPDGLVMPYRILFAEILRPTSDLKLQEAPVAPFAPVRGSYEESRASYVEPWVHRPVLRVLLPLIERLRLLHRGAVQVYLIIALLVLVAILFLLPVIP